MYKRQASGQRDKVLAKTKVSPNRIRIGDLPVATERRYKVDKAQPLLNLQQVNISYNEQAILTDINWQLDWGQHCVITGPNGAGKSTLLSLLSGDNHKAYGQQISLFGNNRGSGESVQQLKQKFGIVNTCLLYTSPSPRD